MGVTTRCVRPAILVAIAALALVIPATAGAQITSFSVTVGHLQAQGTEVPMQVDFQCDAPGMDLAFVEANLTQVSGHKLAQGFGSADVSGNALCDSGFSLPVTVTASGAFAYKQGVATVSVDVGVVDPTTGIVTFETFTQTTRLTTK